MTRLLNLARDQEGASIIELALVAPFLATLVIGVVDISGAYSQKLQLEQAAQRTIEKAMQAEPSDINGQNVDFYKTLKIEAATAAGVAESAVTVKYWLECNGVSQNTSPATMDVDYDQSCSSGTYARYVSVSIQKIYAPMFNVDWLSGANPDGTFTLIGAAGIRVQ